MILTGLSSKPDKTKSRIKILTRHSTKYVNLHKVLINTIELI